MMLRCLVIAAMVPVMAFAAPPTPLKDVERVREGIMTAGAALMIEEECGGAIDVRRAKGLLFLNSLRNYALSQGYSRQQIDAYLDDDAEEQRLRTVVRQRLEAKGARAGDPASWCAVGQREIQAKTEVGGLLK